MRNKIVILLCVAFCFLAACAKKQPAPPIPPQEKAIIQDLAEFPQNLEVYAKNVGPNKRLISQAAQAEMDHTFNQLYFGPWQMSRTSISRREASEFSSRAHGYKSGGVPWSQPEWDALKANAAIGSFPSRATQAITLRQTDLRELPTHEGRFSKPSKDQKSDPFDYFQYSLLPPGMPLLIAHTSRDGRWHYVECPIAGGWVAAADVAIVSPDFKSEWLTGRYAALVAENVSLPGTGRGGGDSRAGIGTILPVAKQGAPGLNVLVPVAGKNGFAETAEIALGPQQAQIKPYALTPGNVAKVGNAMLGQGYGWGGTFGLRDCSAMIRDLYAPFGLWLPRNSRAQARRGSAISLAGLTAEQKAQRILVDGVPFLSLIGLPGHITLYIGPWRNKPALFHNAWGLRIIKDGNDDERLVIGRAVITSIMPGMELPELYRPRTFVDRIRSLTRLGPRGQ